MISYIYALCEDTEENIRYIGYSKDPEHRYRVHLRKCNLRTKNHKTDWLNKLIRENRPPILIILDECDTNNIKELEIFYIDKYRKTGYNLVNCTDGGDGLINPTPEVRKKMSENNPRLKLRLGSTPSKETREKISGKLKGRKIPLEVRKKIKENSAHTSMQGTKQKNSSSVYVGVYKSSSGKWNASIKIKSKKINIGSYFLEIVAAYNYNRKALELFGENAKINILDISELENSLILEKDLKDNSKSSIYRGVHFVKQSGRWKASAYPNNKYVNLGTYDTEKEAGIAYNNFAMKEYGDKAKLNKIEGDN